MQRQRYILFLYIDPDFDAVDAVSYSIYPANYLQGPAYSLGPGLAADPEDPAVLI